MLDTGTFVDPGAGTVAELMTRWLESIKDKKSERTYVRYEQMVRNQIVPDLGHIKLAQLPALAHRCRRGEVGHDWQPQD